jgi:hypothetical protein
MLPVGVTPPARTAVSLSVTGDAPRAAHGADIGFLEFDRLAFVGAEEVALLGLGVVVMVTGLFTQTLTTCEAVEVLAVVLGVTVAVLLWGVQAPAGSPENV